MIYTKIHKPPFFARIVMVLLLIAPVLQCYGWGKFDFSFIIMSSLSIFHLFFHGIGHNKTPKTLLCYWGWWYISHILSSSSLNEFIHLGILKTIITYIMYIDLFDIDYFMPKYRKFANFFIAFFFIQEFSRVFFGYTILNVVKFLPLAVAEDAQSFYTHNLESDRSSSLFKEPAVFAQYLLPLLCYELFAKVKLDKRYIAFLIFVLLWSRSGNGMIGLIAIAFCYIVKYATFKTIKKNILFIIFASLLSIATLSIFIKTDGGQVILDRASTIDIESTVEKGYAGSTFLRLYQGFFIFEEYSDLYKVIGNDHSEYFINRALYSNVLQIIYGNADLATYFNTISSVLIYTGYIGLILMILFVRFVWKYNNFCGRSMLILLISISLISSNFFTSTMALFLLPAISMKRNSIFISKNT